MTLRPTRIQCTVVWPGWGLHQNFCPLPDSLLPGASALWTHGAEMFWSTAQPPPREGDACQYRYAGLVIIQVVAQGACEQGGEMHFGSRIRFIFLRGESTQRSLVLGSKDFRRERQIENKSRVGQLRSNFSDRGGWSGGRENLLRAPILLWEEVLRL